MIRGLLVLVAVLAGGLVGLQVGPTVWNVLEQVGVVAAPVCTDTVGITTDAMCTRPQGVVVFALATTALCAAAAGLVAWHILRPDAGEAAARDPLG